MVPLPPPKVLSAAAAGTDGEEDDDDYDEDDIDIGPSRDGEANGIVHPATDLAPTTTTTITTRRKRTRQQQEEDQEKERGNDSYDKDPDDSVLPETKKRKTSNPRTIPDTPVRASQRKQQKKQPPPPPQPIQPPTVGRRRVAEAAAAASKSAAATTGEDEIVNEKDDKVPPHPPSQPTINTVLNTTKSNALSSTTDGGPTKEATDLVDVVEMEIEDANTDITNKVGKWGISNLLLPPNYNNHHLLIIIIIIVAITVLVIGIWISRLVYQQTSCQLQSHLQQQQLTQWQTIIDRRANDEFYVKELKDQIVFWKRESKKYQSYANGYKQYCHEQIQEVIQY